MEKVKKAFVEAYRAETKNPTADGGVRYSLLVKQTNGTVTAVDPKKITRDEILGYMDLPLKQKLDSNTYFPVRADTPETIILPNPHKTKEQD